ncbi:reactive oxygen species modulator 1-like [Clytia hemisphaerica]|uniref:reactive oxygen species modulator 1-like n=1 Tax=Clytia hemisphaerica TaxID=252671 RepID=UPI0034D421CB
MPYQPPPMQSGPSCFDRMKMGFMIGFAVGISSAGLFGTYSALRMGLRGRELMSNVGKVMIQGGGTFGTFMCIGTAIRC